MKKNKLFLIVGLIMCLSMLLMTSCSSKIKVPDEYAYDDLSVYLELGEYKGIKYDEESTKVTEEELQSEIDSQLADTAETKKVKSGTVTSDSVANIAYVGSIDGEEFDGGSSDGTDLDIDNNTFIDGFADAIIGHSVGETFDINVTFPDDYASEDLAGKPAVFKITINYLSETVNPELTEKWVKNNTDFSSVKEYKQSLTEELEKSKKSDAEANERAAVFGKIVENSSVVEYPEKEYNNRYNALVNTYETNAKTYGYEFADYLEAAMGITEEQFEKTAKSSSEKAVKQELILNEIARREGIEITDKDYQDFIDQILEDSGYTEDTFEQANGMTIQEYAETKNLYTSLLYNNVMDKVMSYSKAK